MAVAFRAAGAKAAGAVTASPALPSGMSADDICILVATTIAGGSLSITINGSISTWTNIITQDVTSGEKLYVWWGRWSSGTTAPTITATSDHVCAGIAAFSGCRTDANVIRGATSSNETTSDTSFSWNPGSSNPWSAGSMAICVCTSGQDTNTGQIGTMTRNISDSPVSRMDYCTNTGGGGGFGLNSSLNSVGEGSSTGTWGATLANASPKAYGYFVLIQPDATTTKTETGKGRIQATTTQTETGKGRIQTTVNQTEQGKARVQTVVNQTITGKANILANTTSSQTEQGVARIEITSSQTEQGKARITVSSSQTVPGVSRMQVVSLPTIAGVARIQNTSSQTISGKGRVQADANQTVPGVARIEATSFSNIPGVARIQTIDNVTITGIARVENIVDKTISGQSRITAPTDQDIDGVARIQAMINEAIAGLARIQTSVTQDITGIAKIALANITQNRTITGVGNIQNTSANTITGRARIEGLPSSDYYPVTTIKGRKQETFAKQGETIYDICIRTYKTLDYLLRLITDNGLNGINDTFPIGKIFIFDASVSPGIPKWGQQFSMPPTDTQKYIARPGQSIYDICLQTYGTLDLLTKLCIDNGLDGIEDAFPIGKIFTFDASLIFNLANYKKNQNQSIFYATKITLPVFLQGDFNDDFNNDFLN